ncbi:MAG: sugar phosphate isomerase/epimerase [Fimbriimonadaceae bacterium]|nr:sugar phosphate isomerase/epimerase [Fimbriimonadaceae bacterium]
MLLATSLNVLYDYTADIDRAVRRLHAARFDALDFNGCDMLPLWRGAAGELHLERLRAAAEAVGLPFVQAHGPMFGYFGDRAAEGVADTLRCIDWCGRLRVPWMVMHPANLPCAGGPEVRQAVLERNVSFLSQFIPALEQHGVGMALENLADTFGGQRTFGSVPEDLIDLCDALDHELVGLCWDTGHAFLQKLPQTSSLRALGSRLKAIHVQDNDGRADLHILPYHGQVNWDEVLAGLRAAGYQGAFTYEVHNAVRHHPDTLRDEALRLAVATGRHLVARFEQEV